MKDEPKRSARRYDVDWLRVIAVCVLVMIHTAAMFDPYPITAVKGQRSFALTVFSTFVHEWRLSVLFIVSGAGSYFALRFLSGREFAVSRFKRIMIPLVAGTLLVVPVQLYYWQFLGNPGYSKTYVHFYLTITYRFFVFGLFGQGRESLHWAHLWFLFYLFVNSLLALPLFLYLRRDAGRRLVSRLAALMERRGAIFLMVIPLLVVEVTLRALRYSSMRLIIADDWANFCNYLVLFVYGFVIFSDDRIRAAVERHRVVALVLGIVTSLTYLYITFTARIPVKGYNLDWTLFRVLCGFNMWFWCVAIFGFGSRYLNFNHRILPYANSAVYPVYVLHLPIATAIAYHVVRLPLPVGVQFAVIVLGTIAASVCIYEFFLRRTRVTRFLFGLKKLKRPARATEPGRAADAAPPAVAAVPEALAEPLPAKEAAR